MNWSSLNPFAKYFLPDKNQEKERQAQENSQGLSDQDIEFLHNYGNFTETAVFGQETVDFQEAFGNKFARKIKYREMSFYPEICQVLEAITDEAIILDEDQRVVEMGYREEIPKAIEKKFQQNFEYVMYELLRLQDRGWELFKKWLVEAEQFIELISDDKGTMLIGYKILPSATTFPVYKGSRITGYVQQLGTYGGRYGNVNSDTKTRNFTENQIAYSNYGSYGRNSLDVLGYLEQSIRVYNQLRGIEDALVVFRMARAPERRIWNVEVGRMSPPKANEFMKRLMQKYRRKPMYDPNSGSIDSVRNIQAVIDDYWFPKRHGEGTTVDTLSSSIDVGKLDDVHIFLSKLYKSLRYPRARWANDTAETYTFMKQGEVDRDEVGFTRFVDRLRMRWGQILMQAWMQQNRLTCNEKELVWNTQKYLVIRFTEDNVLQRHKEFEMLQQRFEMLGQAVSFIKSEENPDGLFDKEYAMKEFFKMTQDEWDENEKLMKKNKLPEGDGDVRNNDDEFDDDDDF